MLLRRLCVLGAWAFGLGGCDAIAGISSHSLASDAGLGMQSPEGGQKTLPLGKVDILFDVDNSASMGDKQSLLMSAIPELITRLVTPRCVDTTGSPNGASADPTTGQCSSGTPEFAPVTDMHIGVVTSSLGPRLGIAADGSPPSYICDPGLMVMSVAGTAVSAFNDDMGHLINRSGPFGSGSPVPSAVDASAGGGFLYWFPSLGNGGETPVSPPAADETVIGASGAPQTLVGDFAELLGGVGESGCGIESQLESWYRFLVQPDPYLTLINPQGAAAWSGVDTTILQQRHDFLRPDSVVAVIVMSDENDSEIDVRSYQGSGYSFLSNTYAPPRSTTPCLSNPNAAGCAPCGSSTTGDPNCAVGTPAGVYSSQSDGNDWGYNLNLRHVHMPQKYGVDPQFPLSRYVNGLTSSTVPNRRGEYPTSASQYTGMNNCTNPLFAASLPTAADVPDSSDQSPSEIGTTLCQLPQGTARTSGDIFFAHIGGVPHELLQSTPGDGTCPATTAQADCPQKESLLPSDWVKILGQGPAAYTGAGALDYDYTGIDPHMIESMNPRNVSGQPNSLPTPASNPAVSSLSGPGLGNGADPVRPDPINGREWTTNTGSHSLPVDRQYACIFQLPLANQRDCAALSADTIEGNSCDCVPGGAWSSGGTPAATGNSPDEIPPLCATSNTDGSVGSAVNDYTVQTYAKAYPTVRELMLTNMLGAQGVVSSMCPIHAGTPTPGDPLGGYLPAMDAIVDRMKSALPPP